MTPKKIDEIFDAGPVGPKTAEALKTGGIFAERERKAAEVKEEAERRRDEAHLENVAERVKAKIDAEVTNKTEESPMDRDWPAEQAERDRFYRNFEILKLAVEYNRGTDDQATALATKYKKWMDEQK